MDIVDRFLVLIFSMNFLDFRLDMIEKQNIINLSSKRYASVVVSVSKVALFDKEKDAAFHPFLYCILFVYSVP